MNKRLAAAGLSASLLAGAAGFTIGVTGTAGAQSDPPTTTAPSTTTKPSKVSRIREALQPLLDNNTLTQAQIDAVVQALQDAQPTNKVRPGARLGGKGIGGDSLSAAATAIGVTEDEVRTALRGGQSLAELATSKGVDPQTVIDALMAPAVERANAAVTAGKLTQAQADEQLANAKERVTAFVNGTAPAPKAGAHKARPGRAPRSSQSGSPTQGQS
jgi:hypothetical protein